MKKLNNFIDKYGFFVWIVITLIITFSRTPFFDETHAFDIACLKLSQIFYLTRVEGHMILWYLILKPFASLKLYPYPMFIINWLFCAGAVFILWKKSPFKTFEKFMIAYSVPVLLYLAPVARCYAIGILFWFMACKMYKSRIKRPYLFTSLLCLCANTSSMALIGSFFLGFSFVIELTIHLIKRGGLKNKNKLTNVILIAMFCAILLLIQFFGLKQPVFYGIPYNFTIPLHILFTCFVIIFAFSIAIYSIKQKILPAIIMIFGIYGSLTYLFLYKYTGFFWNHYWYYFYLIIIYWLFYDKFNKLKIAHIFFNIILFMCLFIPVLHEGWDIHFTYKTKTKEIVQYIINNPIFKNADIYDTTYWDNVYPATGVYLARNNIKILDYYNRDRRSFESLKDLFKFQHMIVNLDILYNGANHNKELYIITPNLFSAETKFLFKSIKTKDNGYDIETFQNKFFIEIIDNNKELGIVVYKINKI